MRLKRFLILNLKIGLFGGIIGLIIYLVFSPIERNNSKNYRYSIYSENLGSTENARYVKDKAKAYMLTRKSIANIGSYEKDVYFLTKNNKAWIIDTIGEDIVKFRAKKVTQDSSEVFIRGYTLIENIHPK